MIKLHSFGQGFGLIDPSPFVVKVDLFMRMNELPFVSDANVNHLKTAPKNKLPYITDGNLTIGDSHFILEYLTDKYQLTLDEHLTQEQKAQAQLFTKAIDEGLYWCLVYSRWVHPSTWPLIKNTFFGALPIPLKWFVPAMLQRGVKKNLIAQGTGRHSEDEILSLTSSYFSSLSTLLGNSTYFFGDKLSSFDAIAYSTLAQFIISDIDNEFNQSARTFDNLVAYCQRLDVQFYQTDTLANE
ncbi:glutathione S-transferase family protein [Thalassotalea fusca]